MVILVASPFPGVVPVIGSFDQEIWDSIFVNNLMKIMKI